MAGKPSRRTNSFWGYTDDALIPLSQTERKNHVRRVIWERDGGKCRFCGDPVALQDMQLDHAVPSSLGGPTHWGNLKASHRRCNIAAGNRHPHHGQMPLAKAEPDRRTIVCKVDPALYDEIVRLSKKWTRTVPMQLLHLAKRAIDEQLPDVRGYKDGK